jgi:hypothetical protein
MIYVGFMHLSREDASGAPIERDYIEHIAETLIPAPPAREAAAPAGGGAAAPAASEDRRIAVS